MLVVFAGLALLLSIALPITASAADLYVCSQGGPFGTGHIYKHLGGSSWENVSEGTNLGQTIMSVETYRGNLVVSTQSASGYGGYGGYGLVWQRVGEVWQRIGVLDHSAAVLFILNENLYCATEAQRIYRYEGTPGSWTMVASTRGTGFRAGVVAELRGYEEVFLGELDRDTFFRFGEKDGLKFLANYRRSCVYAMTEHAGAVYSGCWHGSWYKSEDGQSVEMMGIMGYDHVWGMASFQGKLWIGSGAGRWGDPGKLRSYDGSGLTVVKTFPTTRYAEGVSALVTSPDGKTLYIGLGMTDGYYAGDGNAEVWTYDGTTFTRISDADFFGGGVQFMRFLTPTVAPVDLTVDCLAPKTIEAGGHAVACLKVSVAKITSLDDIEIDLPACVCTEDEGAVAKTEKKGDTAPAKSEVLTDELGFTSQITSVTDNGDDTVTITLEVCADGNTHSLSHFVIGMPPGMARKMAVDSATSEKGWPVLEVDDDKKTGASGIKFDDMTLGEDGVKECETFTFRIPKDSMTTLTITTKAGKGSASVTHTIPAVAGAEEAAPEAAPAPEPKIVRDEKPVLLSVSEHKICFTIPVCHCAEPGVLEIPVRLAGQPTAPERTLRLTVVASVSAADKAAYDLLQRAICEAMAIRRNLDDALISLSIPKAFALAEGGLPAETVSRLTTFRVSQLWKYTANYQRTGYAMRSYGSTYSYPTDYSNVSKGSYSYSSPWYTYDYKYEGRTGLQINSDLPDNVLSVSKVALQLHTGYTYSATKSFPLNLNRLTSSALADTSWSLMDPLGIAATVSAYGLHEIDLSAVFDGNGELNLGIGPGDLSNLYLGWDYSYGSYSSSRQSARQYVAWGPGSQPELRLDYVKGYTAAQVMRFVLGKICHEADGAAAHKAASAFNSRYGKTAAGWGICD